MVPPSSPSYYIVIPAHNEDHFLADALESVVCQTIKPKRVVVVDDNSTDDTSAVIKTYSEKYPFICCMSFRCKKPDTKSNMSTPPRKTQKFYFCIVEIYVE